jgi:hypothetical protein
VDTDDVTRARDWRRHLHRRPGTGFGVGETATFLAETCAELGWRVTTGMGSTGLVASLRRGSTDRAIVGVQVLFTCENFQRAGVFKFRGAYNALAQLPDAQRQVGVVTPPPATTPRRPLKKGFRSSSMRHDDGGRAGDFPP